MRTKLKNDDYFDPPWENDCAVGNVRRSNASHCKGHTDKKPGERPLNDPGRNEYQYYYDWQEAIQRAKAEAWNIKPYDAPNKSLRAVQADFDRMRAYLRGDWGYVVVTVESDDGEYCESMGGIESDYTDETIAELTTSIERQIEDDARKAKINNRFIDAMECGL